jgi:hypothetical protein
MSDSPMVDALTSNTNTIMNYNNIAQANSYPPPVAPQPVYDQNSYSTPTSQPNYSSSAPYETMNDSSGAGKQQDSNGGYDPDAKGDEDDGGCCGCTIM